MSTLSNCYESVFWLQSHMLPCNFGGTPVFWNPVPAPGQCSLSRMCADPGCHNPMFWSAELSKWTFVCRTLVCWVIQITHGLPYCVTCPSMSTDPGSLNLGTRRSRVPGWRDPGIRTNTGAGDTVWQPMRNLYNSANQSSADESSLRKFSRSKHGIVTSGIRKHT